MHDAVPPKLVPLEDSCSSEVNEFEGNWTSRFVAFFSCQRWIWLGNLGNHTHCLLLVLTVNVEVESTTETRIWVQLEDSCSSEVNEGTRTSRLVAFFSYERWIWFGNLGNYTECLHLVFTMNVEVKRNTETRIWVQLEDLCPSEVNEGNRTSHFVAFLSYERWIWSGDLGNYTHCLL